MGLAYLRTSVRERRSKMSLLIKELASVNFFIIWLVIIGGFAFLKIVKSRLKD
jgi:hypothetical protein